MVRVAFEELVWKFPGLATAGSHHTWALDGTVIETQKK